MPRSTLDTHQRLTSPDSWSLSSRNVESDYPPAFCVSRTACYQSCAVRRHKWPFPLNFCEYAHLQPCREQWRRQPGRCSTPSHIRSCPTQSSLPCPTSQYREGNVRRAKGVQNPKKAAQIITLSPSKVAADISLRDALEHGSGQTW